MLDIQPGDVVVVRTSSPFAWLIRLTQRIQGKPDLRNHVAILHHITQTDVAWFLEGRPTGLGWHAERIGLDSGYLTSKWTITNAAQPKSARQRAEICKAMRGMLGSPYDWEAIEADAAQTLHLPELWPQWGGKMPGHVVCSSSAAWAYRVKGRLAAPEIGGGRFTEPADWDEFITRCGWLPAV